MKLFKKMKDGGAESTVTGYWLCEFKSLFSIVLLHFEGESRNAYHEHAFNCTNWLIKGQLYEMERTGTHHWRIPSFKPFNIYRSTFHKVDAAKSAWVLSFRGPWSETWKEYLLSEDRVRTLTNGRIEV